MTGPAALVVEASVLVDALANPAGPGDAARGALAEHLLFGPEHVRIETFHAVRGLVLGGVLSAELAQRTVRRLGEIPLDTVPTAVLLDRMWVLRSNLTGYDAAYVAAAEHLGVDLLTRDRAFHEAPGIRCTVRAP